MRPKEGLVFKSPRIITESDEVLANGQNHRSECRAPESDHEKEWDEKSFKLFPLHDRNIEKKFAESYKSQMDEEAYELKSILKNLQLSISCLTFYDYCILTIRNFFLRRKVTYLLKKIYHRLLKDKDEEGTLSVFMIILQLVFPETLLTAFCHLIEPYIRDIYNIIFPNAATPFRFFPEEAEGNSISRLHDTLRKSRYSFVVSAMLGVLPNLITTIVSSLIFPQTFMMNSCYSSPGSSDIRKSSFNQTCNVLFTWNYPNYPTMPGVAYSGSTSTNVAKCSGVSSGIVDYIGPYDFWVQLQFVIYFCVVLYGFVLTCRETVEKRYVRRAIAYQGIFISCDFMGHVSSESSNVCVRYFIPRQWLAFHKKTKSKRLDVFEYLFYGGLSPHLDYLFILLLCVLYVTTLAYSTPEYATWYVFPETFFEQGQLFHAKYSSPKSPVRMNWCSALTVPVVLSYVKNDRVSVYTALLQGLYFVYSTVQLLFLQVRNV